jgi:uncharacterized membrane protein YphA (DoxX/SURF4 family)
MTMAGSVQSKSRTIATWALRIVLGVSFLAVGTTKLTGTGHTVEYFEAIGWGQWFRYLTGLVDIGGAAVLFVPRWACYGAIALACSVGLATVISLTLLRNSPTWGGTITVVVPLAFTYLAAVLAWLSRAQPVA